MKQFPGVHLHSPGSLSLGGVLDVGLKCPHSCLFCYYSFWGGGDDQFQGLRNEKFRSREDCLAIIRKLAENGLMHVDITGGEPTAHPDIVDIVATASESGIASRCITLGQFLMRQRGNGTLLDELLNVGLTDLLFSLHAVEAEAFHNTCKGDLKRVFAAMDVLDTRGIQYACNCVIMERNLRQLPEIARLAVQRGIYAINFIAFNAYHAWRGAEQARSLQSSYSKIRPFLEEAVAILTEGGVAVNIRYVPLCVFPSLTRHVVGVLGVPYDPYEWRNRCLNFDKSPEYCAEPLPLPESGVRDIFAFGPVESPLADGTTVCGMRGDRFKYFPTQCAECQARKACDGVDPVYLSRYGSEEFAPIQASSSGPLLKARLQYLPPFLLKTQQDTDMRGAIKLLKNWSDTE